MPILLRFLFLLYVLGFFVQNPLFAQEGFDLKLGWYQFKKHRPEIRIPEETPMVFELSYRKKSDGRQGWAARNRFPLYGIRMIYVDYENPNVGKAVGLQPWIGNNLWSINLRRQFFWQMGAGMAYYTNRYHAIYNPDQTTISTPLNVYIDFRIGYRERISERDALNLSFGLIHFSNAATKLPNLGMNLLGGSIGYAFGGAPKNLPSVNFERKKDHENEIWAGGNIAFRHPFRHHPRFVIGNTSIHYQRYLNHQFKVGVGGSIFYEAAEKKYHRWARQWGDRGYGDYQWDELLSAGLFFSGEWLISRLSVYFETGWYVWGNQRELSTFVDYALPELFEYQITILNESYFQRLGLRYKFHKRGMVHVGLKSNLFVARYPEFGLNWQIFRF